MPERLTNNQLAADAYETGRDNQDIGAYYGITLTALIAAINTSKLEPLFAKTFTVSTIGNQTDEYGEVDAFEDEVRKATVWSALEPFFVRHPNLLRKAPIIYKYAAFPARRKESQITETKKVMRKAGMSAEEITALEECQFPKSGVVIGLSKEFVRMQANLAGQETVRSGCLNISLASINFDDIVGIEPLDDNAESYLYNLQIN